MSAPDVSLPVDAPSHVGPRVRALQATIVAVTLAWSLSVVSFLDVKEAALWTGVVVVYCLNLLGGRRCMAGLRALAPCWFTLAAVVPAGLAAAEVPWFSAIEGLRLLPLLLLATLTFDLLQEDVARGAILRAMSVSAFGAALLALFQTAGLLPVLFPAFPGYDQSMYSVFGNEGLLGGFLALGLVTLPGALRQTLAVRRRSTPICVGAAIAVVMFSAMILSNSRGALLALLAGSLALVGLRMVSLKVGTVVLTGAILLVAALHAGVGAAPWERWAGTLGADDTGGHLRPWVWRATLQLAGAEPVLGAGLGNYAFEIPQYLGAVALEGSRGTNTLTTYHAHMDLLEWISETGFMGLVLFIWVVSRLRAGYPAAIPGLVTVAVFSLFHPAWHSAPHALAAVLLYTMCLAGKAPAPAWEEHGETWRHLMGALIVTGSLAFILIVLYPSFLLRRAEDLHLAGLPATEAYRSATSVPGFHPEAHEGFGIHGLAVGDLATARREFALAKRGLDTGRICQLLGMTAAESGDAAEACYWYRECLRRWPWATHIRALAESYCATPSRVD